MGILASKTVYGFHVRLLEGAAGGRFCVDAMKIKTQGFDYVIDEWFEPNERAKARAFYANIEPQLFLVLAKE